MLAETGGKERELRLEVWKDKHNVMKDKHNVMMLFQDQQ